MRVCHTISASFDDPNLICTAGLVMALAEKAGLYDLVSEHLRGSDLGFRNLTHYIARSLLQARGFEQHLHR